MKGSWFRKMAGLIGVWMAVVPALAEDGGSPPALPTDSVEAGYAFRPGALILPASLIAVGVAGSVIDGMNDFHLFRRGDGGGSFEVDNYMEWGMLGWVFLCDLTGKGKHSVTDHIFLLALAEGMNAGMVHGLKKVVDKPRPDGAPYAFPSGHTANAFLGAHLAWKEFKDSNPVLAYSGYVAAAAVGGMRLYKNRHWVSDVVAGAGFGILSVELSYLIYFSIRRAIARCAAGKAANRLVIAPAFHQGGGGLYLSLCF
ncbi:MAG: phosphatase PAP2 family protein [Tannerellaceae bacterium]|jgi:membrane-associated phospholipid phosphatase|nr:phosphatase PAP2 family protein [Tannerellaceae bacterium]